MELQKSKPTKKPKHNQDCNESFAGMSKGESRVCICHWSVDGKASGNDQGGQI